ncbi:MAG: hypothetical protein U1E26_10700 [Coriobacteriia bacterium]|nr:hypothetical protein [Coriobacteriia bacterium]
MPTAAAKRAGAGVTAWDAALARLADSLPGRDRAEALIAVADVVAGADPELARFRFSLAASLRGAIASDELADRLAGGPRILVDQVELPGFTAGDIAREATVRGLAHARVLDEEMLTASAVSALLGSRSRNPRQYANRMRTRGEIVGVPHHNQFLYPAFQFDAGAQALHPGVSDVNVLLDAAHDPWGVASWWITPHTALDGAPPRALLGAEGAAESLAALSSDVVFGE